MDMEALMAQAAELQNKVNAAQEKLAASHVMGIAAGGACVIDMTGKYDVMNVTLRDDAIAGGAEKTAEIVLAALKDAKDKADALIDRVMSVATAGMPMPK